MSIILSTLGDATPPTPRPKNLTNTSRYFSKTPPVPGERPRSFVSEMGLKLTGEEGYTYELPTAGLNVLHQGALFSPLFDFELLNDGNVDESHAKGLALELKLEVRRLQQKPAVWITTQKALDLIRDDVLTLYELGYTHDELHQIVKGTLRISITIEEFRDAMLLPL